MDITWIYVLSAFVVVCLTIKSFVRKATYKFPPGPAQLPVIGNPHNVDSRNIHKALWDHREKYGEISWIRLAGKDIIVLNSINAVQEALKSQKTSPFMINRPESFFGKYIMRGDIPLSQFSDNWQKLRSVVYNGIVSTIDRSDDVTSALNDEFEHLKAAFRENLSESFDPREILSLSSINCVVTSLVSRRLEYNHPVFALYHEYDQQATALFTTAARLLLNLMPIIRFLPFGYGAHYRRLQDAKAKLARYLIRDIKHESESDREKKSGIIYEMLRAKNKQTNVMDENIETIILTAHSAGTVSIRASLFAIFYHLLHHPRVQTEIYREIVTTIGKSGTPNTDDKARMPYTQAVILESMRLTSVVPLSVPRSNSDVVSLADFRLPRGTTFMSNHWRIHHDEELFEDPWSFKPERFLDESGALLPSDHQLRQAVIPFGMGQRSCLGQSLSTSRIFLYVVNVCQSFVIYNDDPMELGSEVDPRDYTKNTVMYVPEYKIRVRERE